MLSSRYLHLHQALGLGPMWLQQGARVLSPAAAADVTSPAAANSKVTTSAASTAAAPMATSVTSPSARQAILASLKLNQPAVKRKPAISDRTETNAPPPFPALSADTLPPALAACKRCPLHGQRRQPLPGHGSLPARLLVLSPNPSPEDDTAGHLFSGEAGALLANMLAAAGIDMADVYCTSLVKCTPNASLKVDAEACAACQPVLQQQIGWVQPKAVLLLGQAFARYGQDELATLLQHRRYVVVPHPARLLRQSALKADAWQALRTLATLLAA